MAETDQGAIDMARIQLRADSDPENKELARHIIAEQQQEIAAMTLVFVSTVLTMVQEPEMRWIFRGNSLSPTSRNRAFRRTGPRLRPAVSGRSMRGEFPW